MNPIGTLENRLSTKLNSIASSAVYRMFRSFAQIALVAALAGVALAQTPTLTVNAGSERHPISPDIYGVNNYSSGTSLWGTGAASLAITPEGWGGDATETYNYLIDEDNAGADYWFIGGANTNPTPSGQVNTMITFEHSKGGKSLVTIPIIGWVDSLQYQNCSYPESLYPNQKAYSTVTDTVLNSPCGDGQNASGTSIQDTNPGYNHIPVNPTWMTNWYQLFYAKYGPSFNADGSMAAVLNGGGTRIAIFWRFFLCCVEVWRFWSRFWMGCGMFVRVFPMHGTVQMRSTRWRILGCRRFPCFSCRVSPFCPISGDWSKVTAHPIAIRCSA